ncbi:SCO0930 family lipoprotein [Amycolatopsis sp. DG1A-15b]|uniref:SCO0930 family lipoprotein n=1 Tax=Amycolatopsis sp. DG1A-15b TaxID=3052846 RepID=UPI00255BD5C0|nr:SCO0930 family lipoprotein [Amycolatopsis sp. DG1A-15b]WIX89286.1 SCO0930 family lipoprotein [Amycolatopsis sp. DG1A-15b]
MNRARPAVAAPITVAGLALVAACGTNPYATSGAVQPVVLGAQQQPASAVPAGSAAQLISSTVDGLGTVLADAEGHTLYRYAKDTAKPSNATCAGPCAMTWPPLVSDVPVVAAGVDSALVGLVTRPDGRKQVTVGGWPVYRYAKDTGPGIALGRAAGADWAAIAPTGEKAGTEPPTLGTTEIDGLGPVLTDTDGRTLYLFTKDGKDSGKSACDAACARKWPPLEADGRTTVADGIDAGLVGRIRRPDGTSQVTVGGWPVYRYASDDEPGTATGHGAGGTWYALEPNGCKADPARRPAVQQAVATSSGGY